MAHFVMFTGDYNSAS